METKTITLTVDEWILIASVLKTVSDLSFVKADGLSDATDRLRAELLK